MPQLDSLTALERERHVELAVSGTVQGVGFRPFVFRLARKHMLKGWVRNGGKGVTIRVCGPEDRIRAFAAALRSECPPGARIDEIVQQTLAHDRYNSFEIVRTEDATRAFTQVSADLALCDDCRLELDDFYDRRFRYPFINCTQCGPRFTIIRAIPYDRPQTTMAMFEMCPACGQEYSDPLDCRFHAQPVACSKCGPTLRLMQSAPFGWQPVARDSDAVEASVEALRLLRIVMLQGIGGFHLACDARDEATVSRLRDLKGRQRKPFAVMFPDEVTLRSWCQVSLAELRELRSSRAPIVLLRTHGGCRAAPSVAPENPLMGALLPYSPLHVLLLQRFGAPLVMTSANRSEEPIQYRIDEALDEMRGLADAALVHDRAIHIFADDSIVRIVTGKTRVLRRSRGYVPMSIHAGKRFRRATLAFGAELKNTFCLAKHDCAILSQHLGDLQGERALECHDRALKHFLSLYNADIELAACDLHPDYTSTRIAESFAAENHIPLIRVQHHHAHLVSCLAEYHRTGPALGVCLDGTGYGMDGTIWGGELLYGDCKSFRRIAHLQSVPLLGNDLATQDPWRMALAWLDAAFEGHAHESDAPLIASVRETIGEESLQALLQAGRITGYFPQTSAAGRLFDAVAALLFFGSRRQYEGEAAMQLEHCMSTQPVLPYTFDLKETDNGWVISAVPMIRELVDDLRAGIAVPVISRRFHEGLVAVWLDAALRAADMLNCRTIALSGGCFQNAFLLARMENELRRRQSDVLTHRDVPANDGGIALGQVFIASAQDEGA